MGTVDLGNLDDFEPRKLNDEEDIIASADWVTVEEFGDVEGHPFRGNQWTKRDGEGELRGGVKKERSWLPELKGRTLADDIRSDPNRFKAQGQGGGISESTWYRDTSGDRYLVKGSTHGNVGHLEPQAEMMAKSILDKTGLINQDVALGKPLEPAEQNAVVIQHFENRDGVASFQTASQGYPSKYGDGAVTPDDAKTMLAEAVGMDMFDVVTQNPDRHEGNWGFVKMDDGTTHIAVIDNSYALGRYSADEFKIQNDKMPFRAGSTPNKIIARYGDMTGAAPGQLIRDAFDEHIAGLSEGVRYLRSAEAKKDNGITKNVDQRVRDDYNTRIRITAANVAWLRDHKEAYVNTIILNRRRR